MKIHSPNKQYTGTSASVSFCNGVGETDNTLLLDWFRAHDYTVEEAEEKPEEDTPESEAKKGRARSQKAGE